MQNNSLPLLSIHRENYLVPKGEERIVHYKAEKVLYDPNDGVTRLSHPDLLKTNVKMFDDVKRNLELQGYTIEILHHPEGKYTNVVIKDSRAELAEAKAELAAKDDEIARLKAELAAKGAAKKEVAPEKEEAKEEISSENEEATAELPKPKKGGKTKKGE